MRKNHVPQQHLPFIFFISNKFYQQNNERNDEHAHQNWMRKNELKIRFKIVYWIVDNTDINQPTYYFSYKFKHSHTPWTDFHNLFFGFPQL